MDKVQYDCQEEEDAPKDDVQHAQEGRASAEPRRAADYEELPDVELREGLFLFD